MKYKIIRSNSAVNVIEADGEVIQLSASVNIEDYLARKAEPSVTPSDGENLNVVKPKTSKPKRLREASEE